MGRAAASRFRVPPTGGFLAASLTLVAVAACGPSEEPGPGDRRDATPAGPLVIVGGALDEENDRVWRAVLDGRDGRGPLCVIPTASGAPERSMESARETLDRHGGRGTAVGFMITVEEPTLASDPEVAALLLTCSGYWFTGGAQSRIVDTFLPAGSPTPAFEAIWTRFQEGAVVAGSSAGAAMMSDPMIAGGSSGSALRSGLRAEEDGEGVWIRDGLGFFDAGVLDQHFLARGRIGRLLVTVQEHPEIDVGFGIDENTAMVVEDGVARVVGASGVIVVDGRRVAAEGPLRVTLAGDGDRIDLAALDMEFADRKDPFVGEESPPPRDALFEDWVFVSWLAALAGSPETSASFEMEEGSVTITEGPGFLAVADSLAGGVAGAPAGFGAGPFRVELDRAR